MKSKKAANKPASKPTNKQWGGRFDRGPDEIMEQINASIDFDWRLYAQDIAASLAHAKMLVHQGIISAEDGDKIAHGLDTISREIDEGRFEFDRAQEDIHMNIEARLATLIGDAAGRLHTARSRNDQVATDLRLWVRATIDAVDGGLENLQAALIEQAEKYADWAMPGMTHLQNAQPVTFGHHLLAYVEMFGRDRERFADARRRTNRSPLGAAALAGTSFAIDRDMTAAELGFDEPMANSMDAVSDRDFVIEFLAAATLTALHASRFSEEIVIWCNPAFGFVRLSDAYSTGSSIMPQKRNPDAAELIRGKVGRIAGALNSLILVMKGLPLTYAKDMQEDKEPLFDAADNLQLVIAALAGMILDLEPDKAAMETAAGAGFSTATDLADWLVRELGLAFRDAHHVTGRLVRVAEDRNGDLADLTLEEMRQVEPKITASVYDFLTVEASVASRSSFGGTAPKNVRAAIQAAKKRFLASG